jgi:hypothetical protein
MILAQTIFLIIKNWWWVIAPLALYYPVTFLYLWWINWDIWNARKKWTLIEIKPPREVLKPFKAMEDIFSVVWSVIDYPVWRERWCEGMPLNPEWFSIELVSLGGEVHFYLRIRSEWKKLFESTFYAHYPDIEITEAEDYTKKVPHDIPNEDWDLYGEEFILGKPDPYPIKTYSAFFEERPEIMKEEKRIDPINSLLEQMSKLQSGEQVWIQIVCIPADGKTVTTFEEGRKIADKIARRPPAKAPVKRPILQEVADVLIYGKVPEEEKKPAEVEIIPPEMKLTPGEKRILTAVENKISKYLYKVWIRTIYIYKKDEPYFYGNYRTCRAYLLHFADADLNHFRYWGGTRTRIHYWFRKTRLYLRKRKMFKYYIERLPPLFPRLSGRPLFPFGRVKGCGILVLNVEELATIFHLPATVAPLPPEVPRVEAKRGGPPPELPTEEIKKEIPPEAEE